MSLGRFLICKISHLYRYLESLHYIIKSSRYTTNLYDMYIKNNSWLVELVS